MSDNEIKPKLENDSSEDSESGGENETDTASNVSESKPLTFKDWKSLREAQNKLKDNNSNQNNNTNDASSNNSNNRFGNNFGWNVGPNLQVPQNVFGRTNFGNFGNSSPQFNISPMGINNYFNNKNNFSNSNSNNSNNSNSFNNNKLFSNYFNKNRLFNNNNNNFNNSFTNNNNSFNNNNNFNNSMFDGRNNGPNGFYNNGNDNFNRQNNLNNGHDNFNRQNNLNNARLPDNFFPSDGNRFRNEKNELLNKKPNIFVPNPKPTDGEKQVPFIPKPSMPQDLGGLTAEEKKQQWKDYREAMKPFKNRSFYNARRVVQRLGKKDQKDLDEKEILRLANAREIMLAHKQQSNFKTANYSKNNEHNDEHRELYVGQKKLQKDWVQGKEPMPCRYQNYGNFGNSSNFNNNGFRGQNDSGNFNESGRKIVGGFMYRDFVSGGIMKGSAQSF